ncbi:PREDICTED: uncharacterized protein LOC106148544 isoform X2 [Chinchilla lanigera]|uniref:uncharacterized protein LOC106148544 isoform X2 n=1 Tax=Chinchilla lanigera TaxID=34839 RepID=UPI0006985476|nr:PREDICTED: uncharacterized protein LOC106148544 isoform X2 [Chinchilla lanigera]
MRECPCWGDACIWGPSLRALSEPWSRRVWSPWSPAGDSSESGVTAPTLGDPQRRALRDLGAHRLGTVRAGNLPPPPPPHLHASFSGPTLASPPRLRVWDIPARTSAPASSGAEGRLGASFQARQTLRSGGGGRGPARVPSGCTGVGDSGCMPGVLPADLGLMGEQRYGQPGPGNHRNIRANCFRQRRVREASGRVRFPREIAPFCGLVSAKQEERRVFSRLSSSSEEAAAACTKTTAD